MKKLKVLLFITSMVFESFANDSSSNKIQIDLNMNATKFVKQFVNFNNSNCINDRF